jgi:hypothetical protein
MTVDDPTVPPAAATVFFGMIRSNAATASKQI